MEKGESLYDTVKTFESVGYDAVVIRHRQDEYFRELEGIKIPIINAGDGAGNHPTQCLLDLLTLYQEFGRIEGIRLAIIGDIQHSASLPAIVRRWNCWEANGCSPVRRSGSAKAIHTCRSMRRWNGPTR